MPKKGATPAKKTSAKPQKKAVKKTEEVEKPVIDTSLKNDRSIEIRGSVSLTAVTAAQIQRALILQGLAKAGAKSSLKFYMGPSDSNRYRLQDQAAMADTMVLANYPVDAIIRSGIGSDVLKTFLSATGKRFMYAGANLHMGPVTSSSPYGKNKASQVRRQLFNDYKTDLQTLVMMKTGETDRTKVYRDLLSARGYNAIEALAYGKRGLIDGILVGREQVITRDDLDAYYKKNKMKAADIETFNERYMNVYKLPSRSLAKFSPESVPEGTASFYVPLKKDAPKPKKKDEKEKGKEGESAENKAEDESPKNPVFYFDDKKFDTLPMITRATKDKSQKRMMVEHVAEWSGSILEDDVIFFNDGFRDETAEQITDALIALDHKKVLQKGTSHIKIIENSPGGSVWSGQELRSLIKSLATPVDVIVYGMGASCGSWLLCSATGNRFATPQARIMFHEAANELRSQTPHDHYNEMHDGLDQATLDYISIVADATGRSFKDVLIDFDHDVWLNPLEALFYGKKGLVDAILVGPGQVILRPDVEKYLLKKLGGPAKLTKYLAQKMEEKRDPRQAMEWRPEKHNENDPFDNPLKVIAEVAKTAKKNLVSLPKFKGSAAPVAADRSIDFYNVVVDEDKK